MTVNLFQPKQVQKAVKRFNAAMSYAKTRVVGRRAVIDQIGMAIITKNHVLLEGPPGVAKSFLASTVLGNIEDSGYFKVACTKKMTEDYVVGPLDMKLFREEGEYYHRVDGYLPTAQYAFLDEFLDLSQGALRALLEILNERTFSRGPQKVRCPLWTCLAATNFSGDSEVSLDAVIDRFLFRAKVGPLTTNADRIRMLKGSKVMEPARIYHEDVRLIHAAIKDVVVSDDMLAHFVELGSKIEKLTDRTLKKSLDVLRAAAVLDNRGFATPKDLESLELCWGVSGDSASCQRFSKAFQSVQAAGQLQDLMFAASILSQRMAQLQRIATAATDFNTAYSACVEARECKEAANSIRAKFSTSTSGADKLQRMIDLTVSRCESILATADVLYSKENNK